MKTMRITSKIDENDAVSGKDQRKRCGVRQRSKKTLRVTSKIKENGAVYVKDQRKRCDLRQRLMKTLRSASKIDENDAVYLKDQRKRCGSRQRSMKRKDGLIVIRLFFRVCIFVFKELQSNSNSASYISRIGRYYTDYTRYSGRII